MYEQMHPSFKIYVIENIYEIIWITYFPKYRYFNITFDVDELDFVPQIVLIQQMLHQEIETH